MVSEDLIGVETLAPLIAVGTAFFSIGMLGIVATKYRRVLVAYWLAVFFGTVFTVWLLAYCFFNKTMMDDVAVHEFEESWATILKSDVLPTTVQDQLPPACGGRNATVKPVELDVFTSKGFTCSEDVDFVEGIAYTQKAVEEIYDSSPRVHIDTCMGLCDDDDGCTGFFYQEDSNDYNVCGFFHSEFRLAAAVYHGHVNGAVCQRDTEEGAPGGESSAPSPEFVLGTSAEFRSDCWGVIEDLMMSNMDNIAICLGVAVLLLVLCIYWSIKMLTLNEAIQAVRKTIDTCMSIVGAVLVIIGGVGIATLGHERDTMYLIGSILLLGALLLSLGVLFGCFSKSHPKCARYAVYVYGVLFVIVAGLAIACIGFEQTVRDKVDGLEGREWLENFCDKDCFEAIQEQMLKSRGSLRTCEAPSGDGPCEADYGWNEDRESDPACNTTEISPACKCACEEAAASSRAAANAMDATKQFLITEISAGLATLGWVCILVSVYILIEALCHLYNSTETQKPDDDSETKAILEQSTDSVPDNQL